MAWGRTHTHTHAYIRTEVISINQARAGRRPVRAWFKNHVIDRNSIEILIKIASMHFTKLNHPQMQFCWENGKYLAHQNFGLYGISCQNL